jgi:hypothetical protein
VGQAICVLVECPRPVNGWPGPNVRLQLREACFDEIPGLARCRRPCGQELGDMGLGFDEEDFSGPGPCQRIPLRSSPRPS